jgi:hypothetical protein
LPARNAICRYVAAGFTDTEIDHLPGCDSEGTRHYTFEPRSIWSARAIVATLASLGTLKLYVYLSYPGRNGELLD